MRTIAGLVLILCVGMASGGEVEDLIGAIKGGDAERRRDAAESIVKCGAEAVAPLFALFSGNDRDVAKAARVALWGIAMRAARPSAEDERLAVCRALQRQAESNAPITSRAYAIELLGLVGRGEVVPVLIRFLRKDALREAARRALIRIPDASATDALLNALQRADESFKPALVAALGARNDPRATGKVLELIKKGRGELRLAAIRAIGRIGGDDAAKPLEEIIKSGDEREVDAAFDSYLRIAERVAVGDVARASELYMRALSLTQKHHQKAAVLVRLRGEGAVPVLLKALRDKDPDVREAAVRGLAGVQSGAVVAAILEELQKAEPEAKCSLLKALAAHDCEQRLPTLLNSARSGETMVRETALELLAKLADVRSASLLQQLVKNEKEELKSLACRAYLSVGDRLVAEGKPKDALAIYREVLAQGDDTTRAGALRGIAAVGDVGSLRDVKPFLSESGAVREEAASACLAIADKLVDGGKKDEAIQLLTELVLLRPPLKAAGQAKRRLESLGVKRDFAREAGFITTWWIIGTFPNPDKSAFEKKFFPEEVIDLSAEREFGGKKMKWRKFHTDDPWGVVDLLKIFKRAQNVAAYAYSEIEVPSETDAVIKLGSDDGVVCWLNGERVFALKSDRGLSIDSDKVKVRLMKGKNKLLLKILQTRARWCFCLRITDEKGKPIAFKEVFR